MSLLKTIILSSAFALFLSCERGAVSVDAPTSYKFMRDGVSSVSYTGQSERLAMGAELAKALKDAESTEVGLLEMFANEDAQGNDVDPFTDTALNASAKSLRSKVAASSRYFGANMTGSVQIKSAFDGWIEAQVTEVFPSMDSLAAPGKAGQVADGSTARFVNNQGLEYDQLVIKGLNGALILDQVLNHYIDISVLDAGSNRENQLSGITLEGKPYTAMEHYWDEGYGYLFGGAMDGALPLPTVGQDDVFMNKYLGRVVADEDFSEYATDLFDAFKLGRAAIVAGDFELRDAQAEVIKARMSAIVGIRAVYYMKTAGVELAAGNTGSAFHDLSEGYGFLYALQFTQDPATGWPYFSNAEVSALTERLMGDGPNGLWDVNVATLDAIAEDIAARFDFTVAQTID